jgi:hypothetical protein
VKAGLKMPLLSEIALKLQLVLADKKYGYPLFKLDEMVQILLKSQPVYVDSILSIADVSPVGEVLSSALSYIPLWYRKWHPLHRLPPPLPVIPPCIQVEKVPIA